MDRRVPLLYRLVADRSGQSEVVAVVLIAGMTIIGTGVVVALGATAFEDTKSHASTALNEQSMSKFDAEAALVALGRSDTRSVTLGDTGGGTYVVNPDQSRIEITHHNYSGSGSDETLYNASLGTFAYTNGDTTIAYEGGGVWRTQDGGTVMVSPPEFRYRTATLTLPIIRVRGDGGGGGTSPRATISSVEQAQRIYGNQSHTYPGGSKVYNNPLEQGYVTITVHSPHYEGWANYFRTRTEGVVTAYDANETVTVKLTTPGNEVGSFEMPAEGNSLRVPAMASDHPIDEYTMNLSADNNFQNGHWEMYYDTSTEDFSLHVKAKSQCKDGSYSDNVDKGIELTIYYNGDGAGDYQSWQESYVPDEPGEMDDSPIDVTCPPGSGNQPIESVELDLMSSEDIDYQEPDLTGTDNKYYFEPEMEDGSVRQYDPDEHGTTDEDPPDGELEPGSSSVPLEWVINHYFSLLGPEFSLTVTDGPGESSRVNEDASFGNLEYDTVSGPQYIQYLHITENEVRVVVSA